MIILIRKWRRIHDRYIIILIKKWRRIHSRYSGSYWLARVRLIQRNIHVLSQYCWSYCSARARWKHDWYSPGDPQLMLRITQIGSTGLTRLTPRIILIRKLMVDTEQHTNKIIKIAQWIAISVLESITLKHIRRIRKYVIVRGNFFSSEWYLDKNPTI